MADKKKSGLILLAFILAFVGFSYAQNAQNVIAQNGTISNGTYIGDGTDNRTIAHGLGVVPKEIIIQAILPEQNIWFQLNETLWSSTGGANCITLPKNETYFFVSGSCTEMNNIGSIYNWVATGGSLNGTNVTNIYNTSGVSNESVDFWNGNAANLTRNKIPYQRLNVTACNVANEASTFNILTWNFDCISVASSPETDPIAMAALQLKADGVFTNLSKVGTGTTEAQNASTHKNNTDSQGRDDANNATDTANRVYFQALSDFHNATDTYLNATNAQQAINNSNVNLSFKNQAVNNSNTNASFALQDKNNTRTNNSLNNKSNITAATKYYVRANGSDTNDCLNYTSTNACLTIQHVLNLLSASPILTGNVFIDVNESRMLNENLVVPYLQTGAYAVKVTGLLSNVLDDTATSGLAADFTYLNGRVGTVCKSTASYTVNAYQDMLLYNTATDQYAPIISNNATCLNHSSSSITTFTNGQNFKVYNFSTNIQPATGSPVTFTDNAYMSFEDLNFTSSQSDYTINQNFIPFSISKLTRSRINRLGGSGSAAAGLIATQGSQSHLTNVIIVAPIPIRVTDNAIVKHVTGGLTLHSINNGLYGLFMFNAGIIASVSGLYITADANTGSNVGIYSQAGGGDFLARFFINNFATGIKATQNGIIGDALSNYIGNTVNLSADFSSYIGTAATRTGTATLNAGTVTVSNTGVTASSHILVTGQNCAEGIGITAKATGSFTIGSDNVGSTCTVDYKIYD